MVENLEQQDPEHHVLGRVLPAAVDHGVDQCLGRALGGPIDVGELVPADDRITGPWRRLAGRAAVEDGLAFDGESPEGVEDSWPGVLWPDIIDHIAAVSGVAGTSGA